MITTRFLLLIAVLVVSMGRSGLAQPLGVQPFGNGGVSINVPGNPPITLPGSAALDAKAHRHGRRPPARWTASHHRAAIGDDADHQRLWGTTRHVHDIGGTYKLPIRHVVGSGRRSRTPDPHSGKRVEDRGRPLRGLGYDDQVHTTVFPALPRPYPGLLPPLPPRETSGTRGHDSPSSWRPDVSFRARSHATRPSTVASSVRAGDPEGGAPYVTKPRGQLDGHKAPEPSS
jgi:hypothetical protein